MQINNEIVSSIRSKFLFYYFEKVEKNKIAKQVLHMNALTSWQLPLVTARGSQLAALFMMGVETALFANDACGAPVPWLMCCPWLFFDGKLFHAKLIRANCARSLVEVSRLYC